MRAVGGGVCDHSLRRSRDQARLCTACSTVSCTPGIAGKLYFYWNTCASHRLRSQLLALLPPRRGAGCCAASPAPRRCVPALVAPRGTWRARAGHSATSSSQHDTSTANCLQARAAPVVSHAAPAVAEVAQDGARLRQHPVALLQRWHLLLCATQQPSKIASRTGCCGAAARGGAPWPAGSRL